MSTLKTTPWTKRLAKKISEITVQNKDELFVWKAITLFTLFLMALSAFYFVRLSYEKTNALLDQTSDTVVSKSGFSIENIDLDAFEKAAALIEYKKNPLTLPTKIRNIFFYENYENISYTPNKKDFLAPTSTLSNPVLSE
ncbi:MAG TPA: hypothetical protein P5230_02370 [Candidatus Magasanikbacteria bacterium]|nr:hypothetical protein [Candidatus Magasanikbacteria bacterium]